MISVNFNALGQLDKSFTTFTKETLSHKRPDRNYVISQLQKYQTQYNKNGLFNDFLVRLEHFALGMEDAKLLDLAGMVYSKLAKFPTTPEMKEQFLRSGLRLARKQGDTIHTLARIVDLKKLYEQTGDKSKHFKLLFSEEKALDNIVGNFGKAKRHFRTVAKGASDIDKYKLQLAIVKTDIAKTLLRKEPQPALSRLVEAREIFLELGNEKSAKFADNLISQARRQALKRH